MCSDFSLKNGASRAQQQTGSVRVPGMTVNTPAPTAVNNNGAALASVSMKVMGEQGTLPYSRQAMAATTSNYVNEQGASVAQEHVKVLQPHYVGDMESIGSTVQGFLYPSLPVLELT